MKIYFYCEENKDFEAPLFSGKQAELLTPLNNECEALNKDTDVIKNSAICLGGFDGIHLGHKKLFDTAKGYGVWGVLLFDRSIKGNENLTTQTEKIKKIEKLGADYVIIAEFSHKFSTKTPDEFVSFLEDVLCVKYVVCGYDYRFGYMAKGDCEALKTLCKKVDITVLNPVTKKSMPIKSTTIRNLLKLGDVASANALLGYNYSLLGNVEKGLGNGKKIGFPTANISFEKEKLLPKDGVYYGRVLGKDAVINVGKNPTFDAKKRTVEVHIIDFSEDIYGINIEAEFIERIRDDIRFDNINDLIFRINKDIEYVKERKR